MGRIIKLTKQQIDKAVPVLKKQRLNESRSKSWCVNLDVEPAKQGRTAAKITPAEFEEKMRKLWDKCTNQDKYSGKYSIDNFVYRLCRGPKTRHTPEEFHQMMDDLAKVEFDFENCGASPAKIQTYDGTCFIKCYAGGDWECSVTFFVYWDGSKFRAYVPVYGNAINRDINRAFGNDDEADKAFIKKQHPDIKDEELSEANQSIEADDNACLKDFKSRIKVK